MAREKNGRRTKATVTLSRSSVKRLKTAGEALANLFGSTEGVLQTQLVKKGRFKYKDKPPVSNSNERYILARVKGARFYLITVYPEVL